MNDLESNALSDLEDASLLLRLLEDTAAETGEPFFRALVRNLALALNVSGAWVTEYLEDSFRLRALAFWHNGAYVPHYEYDITGTPCEPVIRTQDHFHVQERVIELFPDDPDLPEMHAVSYMGAPLLDTDGSVLGHLAILDTAPMPPLTRDTTLFKVFAARAAAELRRLRAEHDTREREIQLRGLFDSAMDAVLEIDAAMTVTQANPAAERMFRCAPAEMRGRRLSDFLASEGEDKLTELMRELGTLPEGQRSIWIPGGLSARCREGRPFAAEATLSCYERHHRRYHVLILRDVEQRLEAERKINALTAETAYLKEEIRSAYNAGEIIGSSKPLQRVLHQLQQVAPTDATVLLLGETGTGKEIMARAIHGASRRRDNALIKVNCAAIPAALIESEFFGHEKGAFTSATGRREGRFALADGGTMFLDEIGEMPLDLQVKLLRVIQEGEFEPVGSERSVAVDVRIIAATNRDLKAEAEAGRFREDLFYRLNVFPIRLPSLRERPEDIPALAAHFAAQAANRMGRPAPTLSPADKAVLVGYSWPGNVRELQNVIERAVIVAQGETLDLQRILPAHPGTDAPTPSTDTPDPARFHSMREWQQLERRNFLNALEHAGWKISGAHGAAALLGIPPTTLASRMKSLGIERPR
jgi:PAS domain S-box-containing protein